MSTQAVTIHLPHALYERVRFAAQVQRRPVEKLLLDAVVTGTSWLDDLPPELADEMAALVLLNDAALWRVARRTLTANQQRQIDALLHKKGRGELVPEEQQALDQLLSEYEHMVLARAQAAILLKQRGYDVSDPAILNEPVT